ncbi:FMN-binding protein [Gillisia mitskevichiae]|uniref:FMN-binding protein n=1 Tax=Gillisia mitskevichiae TaxID=270921 RepID=A0A495NZN9_9FLAO|nr:FMN-binding protein [Gillisia mitskevichiae]RKS43347.1 FMN-binding protein [Gillisia mitskevichiae]
MKFRKLIPVVFSVLFLMSFGIPKTLDKKVDKEVKDVFDITSYNFTNVEVSSNINSQLPSSITNENFFQITAKGAVLGYVYLDKAASKTAQFDYLVIFDKDLKIASTKVLVYREEYGGEIGSRRWLSQFTGKSNKDSLDDIAAISGATISVRSMKSAMSDILESVGILHNKKII